MSPDGSGSTPGGKRGALDLRLMVITDRSLAAPRGVVDVVREALAAGAPAIQLRDKKATARELLEQARALLPHVEAHGALLFVNDRLDVALAAGAHGAHLGPHDLPIAAARTAVSGTFLLGYSTDDPDDARKAEAAGASYIGCGAVYGTTTKPEARGERIGVERVAEVVRAVSIPVLGIGGIDASNAGAVAAAGAAGVAVVGAIMGAEDPGAVVRGVLSVFSGG